MCVGVGVGPHVVVVSTGYQWEVPLLRAQGLLPSGLCGQLLLFGLCDQFSLSEFVDQLTVYS